MTRFVSDWPAWKLRFEVGCGADPAGKIDRLLAELALVAVTFSATAATPAGGTPPFPVTWRLRVCPWPTGPPLLCVSSSWAGTHSAHPNLRHRPRHRSARRH